MKEGKSEEVRESERASVRTRREKRKKERVRQK